MKTGSQEHEQNIKFLSSVRILQGVSIDVLHKIADLLKREFYATSCTIIKQGDQGDKFFIIRGGSVTVTKRMNDGDVRIVGMLKRGDYFGEQALINKARRMASIIANEPGTECLTLDRSYVYFGKFYIVYINFFFADAIGVVFLCSSTNITFFASTFFAFCRRLICLSL